MHTYAALPVEEHLYNADLQFTGLIEYGVSLQDLNAGRARPPLAGARIDITVAGMLEGPRLRGRMRGVDYVAVRADGRFDLHLHATITTDDGATIALFADGIAFPSRNESGVVEMRQNVRLSTASPDYAWVNRLQVWLTGHADMRVGRLSWRAWAA